MIQEDYCLFETSKLLKEKGFDWMCNGYYNKDDENSEPYFGDGEGADNWNNQAPSVKDLWCSAPTHQMAMKWLRYKGIYIEIDVLGKTNIKYGFTILKLNEGEIYSDDKIYTTYEEAVEAALKYVLETQFVESKEDKDMIVQEEIPYTEELKAIIRQNEELRKKYNDALEKAEKIYNSKFKPDEAAVLSKYLPMIFPELKEIKNETIKQEIRNFIWQYPDKLPERNRWLAWFDKQDDR